MKVHCTAERKLGGHEMDWYGILQVEQTVDEVAIKKQYKKLALQLHHDKNQFPGAEAAFKLIGEAQALLLDKGKRSLHDKQRASALISVPSYKYQPRETNTTNANLGVPNNARGNFNGKNLQDQRPQQPVTRCSIFTHWTTCPFCTKKQFTNIFKFVVCCHCRKRFVPERKDASGPSGCDLESRSQRNSKNEHLKSENSTKKVNGKRRRKHGESSSSDRDEKVLKEDGDHTPLEWELSDKKKLKHKKPLASSPPPPPQNIREDGISTARVASAGSTESSSRLYPKSFNGIPGTSTSFMNVDDDSTVDSTSEKELGNEYFKQKKFNEAIDCYSRSIALSPTAVAYANRAVAYLKIKRYREAEEDCTEALNLDDRYIKAYSRRATARKELGKLEEALGDTILSLIGT